MKKIAVLWSSPNMDVKTIPVVEDEYCFSTE